MNAADAHKYVKSGKNTRISAPKSTRKKNVQSDSIALHVLFVYLISFSLTDHFAYLYRKTIRSCLWHPIVVPKQGASKSLWYSAGMFS